MDAYHYQTTCNPSQVGLIISREILIFREREFPKFSRDFPGIPGKGRKWQSNYIKENQKIVSVHYSVRAPRPQF